ncbi:MAG: 3' terminal RNA ribose 2'-O-methyltransferase Hen1 [Planctomycetota bacterium]
MLLTLTTEDPQAADIGFLLHKHPDRFQSFPIRFGKCHVFYPESSSERTTFCLLLDIDPLDMARNRKGPTPHALSGYVNDRPYVASSLMSTAIASALSSAMNGICHKRPELVEKNWEFQIQLDVVSVRGGEEFLRKAFEPLDYKVVCQPIALDDQFTRWGMSSYFSLRLQATKTVRDVLRHLYVLLPVLDLQKHYFSGRDELDKLLAKGESWLADHPEKSAIVRRYLKFQAGLRRIAMKRLYELEQQNSPDDSETDQGDVVEEKLETKISLNQMRLDTVEAKVLTFGSQRVLDLGCGEGKLLGRLSKHSSIHQLVGMDVSVRSLEHASDRLKLNQLSALSADRLRLIHGSLLYRDQRFSGFDTATIIEVIEHLDPPRLAAFERVVFQYAQPKTVIVTTPNAEYNAMWESLPAGKFRHPDHRFEWTRTEFRQWCQTIADRFGYEFEIEGIGPADEQVGSPTQMACFRIQDPGSIGASRSLTQNSTTKTGGLA